MNDLQDLKSELVRICKASPKPSLDMVRSLTQQVEGVGEQVCVSFENFLRCPSQCLNSHYSFPTFVAWSRPVFFQLGFTLW